MAGKKSKTSAANAAGAAADGVDAPSKRSKLKLALFAAVPLLLAGAGYGAWAMFLAGPAEAVVHEDGHAKPDPEAEAAAWRAIASESSFTHSFALSVLIQPTCGRVRAPALREASDAEAKGDGLLAQLSWVAAARRADVMTEKSCGHLVTEIEDANAKAYKLATAKDKGKKGGH